MPVISLIPSRGTDNAAAMRLGAAETARQQKLLEVPGAVSQREPGGRALPPKPPSPAR
ncbi:hypothetical protein QMO56_12655 [Roseomonas sp. E05]|uniref:hypothetical protein n=1 Tax=Roseomonas sp. E05 TaxID=3046310 RepID=UPI0024BB91F7|nr:hypothetical protein [Roseomonas sp. E05]MDJ0388967.1 hypothetical protein [Roseomonas sp. E05]